MFRDRKDIQENLKDPERKPSASYGAGTQNMSFTMSYRKTNKLITALYMVTDIMDKDEPLRNKLRTLGIEIISDINSAPSNTCGKISDIMSFLDIAKTMNIVSQMNCGILEREFSLLDHSIKDFMGLKENPRQINLEEFLTSPPAPLLVKERGAEGEVRFKGHHLGVQKGETLLRSIRDMSNRISPSPLERPARQLAGGVGERSQRREDILSIIKTMDSNATIKDIKDKAKGHSLSSCSEKTIQRELISMVQEGVLKKEGEKRWSRYFLK